MSSAVFQQTTIEIKADEAYFYRSVGTVPVFQGFMALYKEGEDDSENGDQEKILPALSEGEVLALLGLTPEAALYPTSLPIFRGDPDQGIGGERDRQAFHLCGHLEHHQGEGVCEARKGKVFSNGARVPCE